MDMQGKHILIAEDEAPLRYSLAGILEDQEIHISEAANGEEAFELLASSSVNFDLLILDIQMPKLNGLQLLNKLSETDITLPVLVMTGFGDKEMLIQIIKSGCTDYIDKPFSPEEFLQAIETTLKKHENLEKKHKQELTAIKNEKTQLERTVEQYKSQYENIQEEVDKAVGEFNNLIRISPEGYNIHFAHKMSPYASLGGDFIGIHDTPSGSDLLIADVAGHDMAASYHSVIIKSMFEENVHAKYSGTTLFNILNELLMQRNNNDRMVTALYASFDLHNQYVHIVSAGYPFMIVVQNNNPMPYYSYKSSTPLGMFKEPKFYEMSFMVFPNDRLLFYTDGVVSVKRVDGPSGQATRLNSKMLADYIARHNSAPLPEMLHRTWGDIMEFCRYKQNDDMLLAGIEIPDKLLI